MNNAAYQGLRSWYQTPGGQLLLSLEQRTIRRYLSHAASQSVVQIGGDPALSLKNVNTLIPPLFLDGVKHALPYSVQTNFTSLPLLDNKVEVIVLAHALEYCDSPEKLVEACYQALSPGGTLFCFCFNPYSLWGVRRMIGAADAEPYQGKFYSLAYIERLLEQIKFQVLREKTLAFHAPGRPSLSPAYSNFLEAVGQILLGSCGAVSFVMARKTGKMSNLVGAFDRRSENLVSIS